MVVAPIELEAQSGLKISSLSEVTENVMMTENERRRPKRMLRIYTCGEENW